MEPIKIGESSDATASEKKTMKNRAYVLHNKLKKIIDRKDLSELAKYLKPKREFVVSIKMTDFQQFMYKKFLSRLNESDSRLKVRTCIYVYTHTHLFTHFATLIPIPYLTSAHAHTHPNMHASSSSSSILHIHTHSLTHIFTHAHTHTTQLFAAYQVLLRLWNHPACIVMMSHSENLKIEKTLALEEKKAKKDYAMVNGRLIKKGKKMQMCVIVLCCSESSDCVPIDITH
jgi:hypothetical protein